jgi:uncharacterized protein YicC (UPF0701 family)
MRAVNHRFLEFGVRLPEELRALEPALRERVGARVSAASSTWCCGCGRPKAPSGLQVDDALRGRAWASWRSTLEARFPSMRTQFVDLLQFPGRAAGEDCRTRARSRPRRWRCWRRCWTSSSPRASARGPTSVARWRAPGRHRAGRRRRGARVAAGDPRRPCAKLQARVADLPQPLDPGRLEQELVLWLQKLDVDEELDRLDSHVGEARRVLGLSEAVGRRLDFLLQEFNREANTLGSKSVDSRTTQAAVELKVLIEQIREQVQNIE